MKYLFILLLLVSCDNGTKNKASSGSSSNNSSDSRNIDDNKKEKHPIDSLYSGINAGEMLRTNSNHWYFTGTHDDVDFNHRYYGVSTTFKIPKNSEWGKGNAEDRSAWCAIYGMPYTDPSGNYIRPWLQIGAAMNNRTGLTLVYHYYKLGVGESSLQDKLITPGFKLTAGQLTRFEFVNIKGTTWWQIKCNDTVVYEVDFGCTYGVKIELMTEQYSTRIVGMPDIIFDPALEYQNETGEWLHLYTMMSRQAAWKIIGLGENKIEMSSGTGEWYLTLW